MAKKFALPCTDERGCNKVKNAHNCSCCANALLKNEGFRADGNPLGEKSKSVRVLFAEDRTIEVHGTEGDSVVFRAVPLASIITRPRFV
jgi:hypothetical protein